jgi:hypothetical protein
MREVELGELDPGVSMMERAQAKLKTQKDSWDGLEGFC